MMSLFATSAAAIVATSVAAGALGLLPAPVAANPTQQRALTEDAAIRPFRIDIPEEALVDLRRRIAATRWPNQETVNDQSQGIQLAKIKPLVEYWGTGYSWRKAEAKLNALPQFMTTIDGVDIHFIHVRSKHPNAMPLIMTHGWPGSVFELLKIVSPLTDPPSHGGHVEDAFDLVLPSMPGYGFSGKPTGLGWGPDRIGRAWAELMKRLGYTRYVAQGGDWGSPVSSAMARQAPTGLLGIHVNLPATIPPEVDQALANGGPVPAGLSEKERATFDELSAYGKMGSRSYAVMMGTRPQTIGFAITDTPGGLAAWMLGHPGFATWTYSSTDPEKSPDEVLDDITLYWLTNTAASAARLYWENKSNILSATSEKTAEISLPVAITVFPGEVYRAPETWARRAYRNLIYFHEVDKGGHFAAWEQPELFSAELRAAFRPLR
ncbi:epoxide hydrolase [Microvirga sp. CF3062]|uniref:epoxide hydrolase family protein n=1 Tax=Microvirga sp. CF3062 TaxID=3110182 RepID=UPI002E77BFA3|nr:epoxide hydrolase family protein [Microvirga sp. CF3062]MEE1658333.1 epoxide hydrolase [Microvirga sp. CF3062]